MELVTALTPILFFVVIIAIVGVVFLFQRKRARERTQALQLVANQLAWNFSADAPFNMIAGIDRFGLFNQGHSKKIKNFMYGEANGVKSAAFDYIYVTGYGKNSQTHYQSVVYLEPANLNLPFFSLRPEGFFTKFLTAFGYQDIDFGQRPVFSKQYLLRGQDEQGIRRTFNDGLLAFFESYPGTSVDAGGNQLFMFRAGTRLQPQEIQPYLALALNAVNLCPRY